jgi:hypothetical protein
MSWFAPKCPINIEDKEWLEEAFQSLIDEFGAETLRDLKMILPTDEFFPDNFSGDIFSLKKMIQRICGYMSVDYSKIDLELFTDERPKAPHPLAQSESEGKGACGLYQFYYNRHHISIEESLLKNPANLIATIAHELGHARLIGENRLEEYYEDHELLTDLTAIFFGFGVFLANSLFSFEQWTNSNYQGWQSSRQGYITEEMAGYSLALFAYTRSEKNPVWTNDLKRNVRYYFKKSLKYLEKTGDTKLKRL